MSESSTSERAKAKDPQPSANAEVEIDAVNNPQTERQKPQAKWWQWFFLYPAFGVAFLTALPAWVENVGSVYNTWTGANPDTELVRFFRKNPTCVRSPVEFYKSLTDTKVDGTICSLTGDVFLRIESASGDTVYKGIFISDIIESGSNKSSAHFASVFPNLLSLLGPTAAEAAGVPDSANYFKMSQPNQPTLVQFQVVVCEKFVGNTIVRHLKLGNICYDETIDASNGLVKSRLEVPCRSSC